MLPSEYLSEIAHLLTLKGESPFKTRAFENASEALARVESDPDQGMQALVAMARAQDWSAIKGIGKGIAAVLDELLIQKATLTRDELRAGLPEGLLELCRVPGLGPKKAHALIESLGVRSLAELDYAIRENRLVALKGFGEKLQTKLGEGVRFLLAGAGKLRLDQALAVWADTEKAGDQVLVGELARYCEVVTQLEFVAPKDVKPRERWSRTVTDAHIAGVRAHADREKFSWDAAWTAFGNHGEEKRFYGDLGLPWIPPECREDGSEVAFFAARKDPVGWDAIQGFFHFHTEASDGANTLEEMVAAASKRGYRYVGVSEHSQSAFYARGLGEDALKNQRREVDRVRALHPEVDLFWGIESDILKDGSLDYPDRVLAEFDFVIASIHSRFGMDRTAMTERLVRAIENPRTTLIGHLSGRLILGRPGFDWDHETVLQSALNAGVALELNAHPARLDLEWQVGRVWSAMGGVTAINPDAHEIAGLDHMTYGIAHGRKSLFPASQVLNTWSVERVSEWLRG